MEEFQERVVTEKAELDAKLVKLFTFFDTPTFANLPNDDKVTLQHQSYYMTMYSKMLGDRIEKFK